MTQLIRCDQCGKTVRSSGRCVPYDERRQAMIEHAAFIRVEADEDADHGDLCSWQCLAEWAMAKAMGDDETPAVHP